MALLNPKTTPFFADSLPQFIEPQQSVVAHSMMLGSVFVAIAAATDTVYVLLAARVVPQLGGRRG